MDYTLNLKGKNVLITGAAGGIGLECTKGFLENGAAVSSATLTKRHLRKAAERSKRTFPAEKLPLRPAISRRPRTLKKLLKRRKASLAQ